MSIVYDVGTLYAAGLTFRQYFVPIIWTRAVRIRPTRNSSVDHELCNWLFPLRRGYAIRSVCLSVSHSVC